MIIFFLINLILAVLFSLGVLVLVVTLTFREQWKVMVGMALCATIFVFTFYLTYRASALKEDGAELSKVVNQVGLYLQKRNR